MSASRTVIAPALASLAVAMLAPSGPRGTSAAPDGSAPAPAPHQAVSTTLVVNEADYVHPGVDNAEFVELLNVGQADIYLADYLLLGIDGDGVEYRRDRLPRVWLAPGRHFVLGSALVTNVDHVVGVVDIWRDVVSHPDVGAGLALVLNTSDDPLFDVLVDSVVHDIPVDGNAPDGSPWMEGGEVSPGDPTGLRNMGISRLPDGTDTGDNGQDLSPRCITPGAPNTTATGGALPCSPAATRTPSPTPELGTQGLVVNEIDYVQGGQVHADFVEVLNTASRAVDLSAFYVLGIDGRGGTWMEYRRDRLPSHVLSPGETYVFGNDGVPNLDMGLGATDLWIPGDQDGPMAVAIVENPGQVPAEDRLVDSISFEGDMPGGPPRGGTWTERVGVTAGDTQEANVGLSRHPHGTDTDDNGADVSLRCISPGYMNEDATSGCPAAGTRTPEPPTPTPTPTTTLSPTRTPTPTAAGSPRPTPTRVGPGDEVRFLVDSTADDDDADPGDGACATRNGDCTLRAALRQAQVGSGSDPVRIEFVGAMEIRVPEGRPLSDVDSPNTLLTGAAHVRGGLPGVSIVGPRRVSVSGGRGGTARGADERPVEHQSAAAQVAAPMTGLVLGSDVTVQGIAVSGFDTGVQIRADARRATIGSDGDGFGDEREGVLVEANAGLGVEILEQVSLVKESHHRLARNLIRHNVGHGVETWSTKRPEILMTANRIHDNGGAAIAVKPFGDELAPPRVLGFDRSRGLAGGAACRGCTVEVFGDSANEAQAFLGSAVADRFGIWQAHRLDVTGVANLTATARDEDGNTSRLSEPFPTSDEWTLLDVTPFHPRLIYPGLICRRVLRVLDQAGRPVADAALRFNPLGVEIPTSADGAAQVELPMQALLGGGETLVLSLAALTDDGVQHPMSWVPYFVIARGRTVFPAGNFELRMDSLGPLNLGAELSGRLTTVLRDVAPRVSRWAAVADRTSGPQQAAEIYGAGMLVAPVGSREGATRWQENMARGGGIYEVRAPSTGLSGELSITAPAEAFNEDGDSGGCVDNPPGASVAGWSKDKACWEPAKTTGVTPPDGAATFVAEADVEVPSGAVFSTLQATTPYTLYTVGWDTTAPIITTTVGALPEGELPAVVALARDVHAGVDAQDGVEVSLDGTPLDASYDPATGQIRVAPGSRSVPEEGATLSIQVTDGFCNGAGVDVDVVPGGGVLFLPALHTRPRP